MSYPINPADQVTSWLARHLANGGYEVNAKLYSTPGYQCSQTFFDGHNVTPINLRLEDPQGKFSSLDISWGLVCYDSKGEAIDHPLGNLPQNLKSSLDALCQDVKINYQESFVSNVLLLKI